MASNSVLLHYLPLHLNLQAPSIYVTNEELQFRLPDADNCQELRCFSLELTEDLMNATFSLNAKNESKILKPCVPLSRYLVWHTW